MRMKNRRPILFVEKKEKKKKQNLLLLFLSLPFSCSLCLEEKPKWVASKPCSVTHGNDCCSDLFRISHWI